MAGHLSTLSEYGMELVAEADFLLTLEQRLLAPARATHAAAPGKAGFVTAADLHLLPVGETVRLAPGSRLTPQAQDVARRLNLRLLPE
jgi:hypothetical protein